MKDTVNRCTSLVEERLRSQHRLLQEYQKVVEALPDSGRHQELLQRTRVEQAEYARRLGEDRAPAAKASEQAAVRDAEAETSLV